MALIHSIISFIYFWWIKRIICQHFCKFKQAGSNFRNCHVHILGSNPQNYTGLGHDDATPGLGNPGDAKHSAVSRFNGIDFHRKEDGTTTFASDLLARTYGQAYFHPAPATGVCPPGFFRVTCDCGDACVTFDYDSYTRWYEEQGWDNRVGTYVYPSKHTILVHEIGPVECGSSVVISQYEIDSVSSCTGFGGSTDGENALIRRARTKLQRAAGRIQCKGGCAKSTAEIFRGWKCSRNSDTSFLAEAKVQWKISCANE
jgi:hypothetical protein